MDNDDQEVIIEINDDKSSDEVLISNTSNLSDSFDTVSVSSTSQLETPNTLNGGYNNHTRRVFNENISHPNNSLKPNNNNRLTNRTGNLQNYQRPNIGVQSKTNKSTSNNLKSRDVGSHNLQNSLANRARNLWKNRNKNTKNSIDNSNNNSISNDNDSNNTTEFGLDNIAAKFKARLKIKIIIYSSIIIFATLIFFALLFAVFGIDISSTLPAISPNTYGTKDFASTYEKGTQEYKDEVKYYEKLKEVSKNYANNHGEELKTNYIHAILIYIYYQIDMGEISEKGDSIPINYKKMYDMVDKVVSLMTPSDNKNIDYEKGGEFYNNLKNSDDIRSYYSELLKEKDIDSILGEIFDLAKNLDDITFKDDTVITTETKVTVETKNEDETERKTLTINEYIADSIYANTSTLSNSEIIKAYTIAYSTNLASQNNKLSIDSSNVSASNSLCSVKEGCSYDKNGNLVSGSGEQNSKNTYFYNGGYYYKKPLESTEITSLNNTINSVFGNVLVNSDETYPNLDINKISGLGDNYKTILSNSYGNLSFKNIGEDSYILDGSYGTEKVQTRVIFYDQNDYGSYNFCGKAKETIKTSGCGTTSMAIIVSTYENNSKYDPVSMMNEARKTGYCGGGITGTSPGFFKKEANTMKYKYYKASKYNKKDLNLVLQHLAQGHLVIAHMSPGHFTSGGHYMVLGGVDPSTKKVYVYDPYNKVNKSYRKTGNGWYSFNDIIVKEAWNFYIIWKG